MDPLVHVLHSIRTGGPNTTEVFGPGGFTCFICSILTLLMCIQASRLALGNDMHVTRNQDGVTEVCYPAVLFLHEARCSFDMRASGC